MTNISANRLLKDEVGNPSHIAEAAGISIPEIPLFEMNPKELERQKKTFEKSKSKWSVVDIRNYSETEVQEAYHKYAKIMKLPAASSGVSTSHHSPICVASDGELDPKRLKLALLPS
jgi:hypothetical protein